MTKPYLTRAAKRKLPGYEEELKLIEEKENKKKQPKPLFKYPGKYKYITDFTECAATCDDLFTEAEKVEDLLILGFDLEWPFSFQTGPGRTALMQICASTNDQQVYLFHFPTFKKLPAVLISLLSHSKVRLTGVNIRNDIHKLCRDFPGFDKEKELMLNNCIDSRTQAKAVSGLTGWSMEKLVEYFLEHSVDKNKKVRMSKWHVQPLSNDQKKYAATDAYISLKLYEHLKKLEDELEETKDEPVNILKELL